MSTVHKLLIYAGLRGRQHKALLEAVHVQVKRHEAEILEDLALQGN